MGAATECTSPPHAARLQQRLGFSPPPFSHVLLPPHGPQRSFALAPTRPCILTTVAAAVEQRQERRRRRLGRLHWCSRVTWSLRPSRRRTRRWSPCFLPPPCHPSTASHTPPLRVGASEGPGILACPGRRPAVGVAGCCGVWCCREADGEWGWGGVGGDGHDRSVLPCMVDRVPQPSLRHP